MRIYGYEVKGEKITIVGAKDDLSECTTISGYVDVFFQSLDDGIYAYFVSKDREDMEIGLDRCVYTFFDIDEVKQKDVFNYIGNASTHQELVTLIPEYFI